MQQLMPRWSKFYPCNRSKVKEERKDPKRKKEEGRMKEFLPLSLSLSLSLTLSASEGIAVSLSFSLSLLELSSPLFSSL